jgi:hypothetical protein
MEAASLLAMAGLQKLGIAEVPVMVAAGWLRHSGRAYAG